LPTFAARTLPEQRPASEPQVTVPPLSITTSP